jgi:maltose phosphorylase
MIRYLKLDPWNVIEDSFDPLNNRISESLFSIGNGRMGQRGNFEEHYSGDTLLGNYIGGVYYPDKTKVGWWKNGYPEYFAKVLNAPSWIGIDMTLNGLPLDLAVVRILSFRRTLNMKEGFLARDFNICIEDGSEFEADTVRFISIVDKETGAIRYRIRPLNKDTEIIFTTGLDADVKNEDSNYNEKFWDEVSRLQDGSAAYLVAKTRKLDFHVASGMNTELYLNGRKVNAEPELVERKKYIGLRYKAKVMKGEELTVYKYAAILSSLNYEKASLLSHTVRALNGSVAKGFDRMLADQAAAWSAKWADSDIIIEGDVAAQQGIRFNIFQLDQTYTGEDERLNIGPKGFTGEKYGGSTYWDTEAYCLPFYLCTAGQSVARNLLLYRYKHLDKAIENAEKLGFTGGAALYPMVTMNGEECHNEWEITFEEIHRNGAIAYAIYNYINHTGDRDYLVDHGLETLIALSRFWRQRVSFSRKKNSYVLLGVTGPNEYENNVNNNWYTNLIARWTLQYTLESLEYVAGRNPSKYNELVLLTRLSEEEPVRWMDISRKMYLPEDQELGIFLQQDDYLEKEQIRVSELNPVHRPVNQKWSWDRILRSCFIKQADVLQGIYCFEDRFDEETIKRNFDFYESRTLHESSLSPCVHSILASRIGDREKAYELYLRTARLDLDDYNNEAYQGCHITSMAGTWMAIVEGFGGKRIRNGLLSFNPSLPEKWSAFAFKIRYRNNLIQLSVNRPVVRLTNISGPAMNMLLYGEEYLLEPGDTVESVLVTGDSPFLSVSRESEGKKSES